jgi:hypothetical protein
MNLIKKSIFIFKKYGIKAFIKKAIKFPINKINLLKQRNAEKKAKKNTEEIIKILNIDLPEGPFGGGYPEWKIPIYQAFAKQNQKLYLLKKDSHQQETLEEVKKNLNGNQLDFLFIDGDHSYEGVKKDFEMYSSLVRKGGIIAFHDIINNDPTRLDIGVPKFWLEVKDRYLFKEIIIDKINYGIGILKI